MKRMKTTEKKIGDCKFYITPFPAFTAANLSGELASILLPILGAMVPVIASAAQKSGNENVMDTKIEDIDFDSAIPAMSKAMSGLSGHQIETFLKKMLIDYGNVSVESKKLDIELQRLDKDLADEIFCAGIDEMYLLTFEVLKLNFGGFFKKARTQFGEQISAQMKGTATANTEPSM